MSSKNPFDHGGNRPGKDKPRQRATPRAGMMLSAGKSGLEVLSHNKAPDDYRDRMPMSESLPREPVIKPKPARKLIPPSARMKKMEGIAGPNRRAAMLTATAQGFEIMDNNLPKDNYVKRVREAQDLPAAEARAVVREKLTGETYIKAYRKQQAADKAEIEKKAKAKEKLDKIVEGRKEENRKFFGRKQKEDRKQAEAYVTRARQLQAEIAMLKRNLGGDPETDRRLHASIQQLTNELARIPSVYW